MSYNNRNKFSGPANDRHGRRQGGKYHENHYNSRQNDYVGINEMREKYLEDKRKKERKKEKKADQKRRKKETARLVKTVKKAMSKHSSSDSESSSSNSNTSDSSESSDSSDTSNERKKTRKRKRKQKKKKTKEKQKKQKTDKKEKEKTKKDHEDTIKTLMTTLEEERKKRVEAEAEAAALALNKKSQKDAVGLLRTQLLKQIAAKARPSNARGRRGQKPHRQNRVRSGERRAARAPRRAELEEQQPHRQNLDEDVDDRDDDQEELLSSSASDLEDGEMSPVLPINAGPAVEALGERIFKADFEVADGDTINEDVVWFKDNAPDKWRDMMRTIKADLKLKEDVVEECNRHNVQFKSRDTKFLLYARLTLFWLYQNQLQQEEDND
jgi:hypothetical protein